MFKNKLSVGFFIVFISITAASFYAYSAHADEVIGACPPTETCGNGSVNVSGLLGITPSMPATVQISISATDDKGQNPQTVTRSVVFQRADCTTPTARLLVNGASSASIRPGETATYTWSSSCADQFTSRYTYTCTSPSSSGSNATWYGTGSSGGSQTDTLATSQANCSYTFTYTAKKTSSGISTSSTVTLSVLPQLVAPPGMWVYGAWSACSGSPLAQSRTATCVDSQGHTSVSCDAASRAPTSQACTQSNANGSACGTAVGVPTPTPPSSNLCKTGTASGVSNDDPNASYIWSCGTNAGNGLLSNTANCSAPNSGPIAGRCGGATNVEAPIQPNGNFCYVGTASSLTKNGDDTYSWTCQGSGGGSSAACQTSLPASCTNVSATADNTSILYGSQTVLRWTSNCDAVRVTDPDNVTITTCDLSDRDSCTVYNAYSLNPNSSRAAGPGTWKVQGYKDLGRGFGASAPGPISTVNINPVDYAISLTPAAPQVYRGDVIRLTVRIPFGTCVSTTQTFSDGPDVITTHCTPNSFTGNLSTSSFVLSNQQTNQTEGNLYTYPNGTEGWPGLAGTDAAYSSVDAQPVGTFSSSALSAANGYTATLTIPVSASAVKNHFYSYKVIANLNGTTREYPFTVFVKNGGGPQAALGLTITKTIGGSVISADGGISCGIACSFTYPMNTFVTLSAVPDSASWKFIGWSGDCSGTSSTCTVKIDKARVVSAKFSPKPLQYQEF